MKRAFAVLICLFLVYTVASADTGYILCQPNSFVNARLFPVRGAEVAGRLELGDDVETEWVRRNGFVQIFAFEAGEVWVHSGFITEHPVTVETFETAIVSSGRVACRRSIKGTRRKWLEDGEEIIVYGRADDWSVTSKGFVQTKFIGD